MHAAVLTIILMAGTSADPSGGYGVTTTTSSQDSGSSSGCSSCNGGESEGGGRGFGGLFGGGFSGSSNGEYGTCFDENMPQYCYNTAYGCYPGNDRRIHRYPAFHGSYYRKPSNYRHLFDYPWHAGLHEPTSLFSYNVAKENTDKDKAGNGPQSVKSPNSLGSKSNVDPKTKSTKQQPTSLNAKNDAVKQSLSAKYETMQQGNIRR